MDKLVNISAELLPLIAAEKLFSLSILSVFRPIFFKLCIRILLGIIRF